MSSPGRAAPLPVLPGAALLERAVGYTRASLQLVPDADPEAATPCAGWDLLTLLRHMDDSLAAFTDAAEVGYVDLRPPPDGDPRRTALQVVDRLKQRACAALGAWASPGVADTVRVADRGVRSDLLAAAGALEISVHGWDVAQACGVDRPLPPALAVDLLEVVPLLVGSADRPHRFADPVDVPVHARPSSRLLAALGRRAR
jgi:uncharacterized protein (TIGR03086 family)